MASVNADTPFHGTESYLKKKYGSLFDPSLLNKRPPWREISKNEFLKNYYGLHDSQIMDCKSYKKELYFLFKYDNTQDQASGGGWTKNFPFGELKIKGVKDVKFFRTQNGLSKKTDELISANRLFPMKQSNLIDGFVENFDNSIEAIIQHRDTLTRKFTETTTIIKFMESPKFFFRSWETIEKTSIKKILTEVVQQILKKKQ